MIVAIIERAEGIYNVLTPMGGIGQLGEFASMVLFLASEG